MQILILLQVLLLLSVVVAPVVVAMRFRKGPSRSLSEFGRALWPYLLLAIPSALLAQASKPGIEWALPLLVTILLALLCRHEAAYRIAWWATYIAAIVLIVNFLFLCDGHNYSRDKRFIESASRARLRSLPTQGKKLLQEKFGADIDLPAGPVSKLVGEPGLDELEAVSFELEWHSPLTGLFRVRREKMMLWYPGGKVGEGVDRLDVRPHEQ